MSHGQFGRRDLFKKTLAAAGAGVVGAVAGNTGVASATTTMPMTELGSTGKKIPRLLLGCGQKFDPVYDKVLHRAFSEGVTYLDGAESYARGQSHIGLGNFIEQIGRDKVWLTSKVLLPPKKATPEEFKKRIDAFLPVLHTDHLDMFFMHAVRDPAMLDDRFIRMAQELKKSGKIHHFGFSCHDGTVVDLLNKAAKLGPEAIDAVMFRYNFAMYGDLELNKAMDACKAAGVGLIAMKTQTSVPEDAQGVQEFQSKEWTLPQAKLKSVWADERIDAAVSHMTNVQQIQENVAAVKSTAELSARDFVELNRYAAQTASSRCLGCNQICESRVDGDLRIADLLRYKMYDECYGDREQARSLFAALSPAERRFEGIDLAEATRACPQGIDIPAQLRDAHRRLA